MHRSEIDQGHLHAEIRLPAAPSQCYYVELPSDVLDEQDGLLDSLIRFTFDTLNIQHLDLRIVTKARSPR